MLSYFDDLIETIAFDPFTPLFATRKGIRSSFDGRITLDEDLLKVSFDVPGVKKEAVDVTFEAPRRVKVVAKRSDTGSTSTWWYNVPETHDPGSADAKLEDGVLTVSFAKKQTESPRKLLIK